MRILSFSLKITLLALLPLVTMMSCKDDPVEPDTATISGTITIENTDLWATWQDSGEVQLTIFPAFSLNPPAGWGDIPVDALYPGFPGGRFALGAPVNAQNPIILNLFSRCDTVSLYDDTGTRDLFSTCTWIQARPYHRSFKEDSNAWRSLEQPQRRQSWCSHQGRISAVVRSSPSSNEPAPSVITLEKGDNLNIDFKADFGFVEEWYQ